MIRNAGPAITEPFDRADERIYAVKLPWRMACRFLDVAQSLGLQNKKHWTVLFSTLRREDSYGRRDRRQDASYHIIDASG